MRAGFEYYRAFPIDAKQNKESVNNSKLQIPVFVLALDSGDLPGNPVQKAIEALAENVTGTVVPLAYPSHHLDALRGLKDVSFIYIDEADFFPPGQQQDARDVSERYIGKSNPWIVMVSTPNAPDGLFERIEKEPQETCLYHRLFLDFTYGLDRIYNREEIAAAKASPSFEREYNLKYLGRIGNVFHTKDIEAAIQKGEKHSHVLFSGYSQKSMVAGKFVRIGP
jgi:hypothetical protein